MIFELILYVCVSAINSDDLQCAVFRQQLPEEQCYYFRDKHNGSDSKYIRKWIDEIDDPDKAILMEPARCKDTGYKP